MRSNFQTLKLRDVIEIVIDNRGRNPKSYSDYGVPVIDNYLIVSEAEANLSQVKRYIDEHTYNTFIRKYISKGDVLMTLVGNGYGKVAITPEQQCIIIQNTIGLRCNKNNDNLYLYYLLKANREVLMNLNRGAAQPSIKVGDILDLEFTFPPLHIQQKIGSTLGGLDKKSSLNSQANQTLEEMAQAIFKSWFVDFDPVKAKMNGEQPEGMDVATASLFPEKLVESELGLVPEGWPVDQVGNHIDVTKGKSYKSAELQESTTALVTLKSFKRGGGYRMDGLKEYTGKYKPQQVIEAGDLVMSLTDVTQAAEIVGKPALVIDAPQYDTLVASLDVAILRTKETDAKQYFYGLMSTYRFHRYAESFATGTTVLHLSPKGITTFEFACPSAELVKKYHEFAAPIFAKIEANILESQELAKLRDTLLPKLLSGEINLETTEELVEVN